MRWESVLKTIGDEPVFRTGLLLTGDVDPHDVRRQLGRWVRGGKLMQLRRGVYAPAGVFQRRKPHPFVVANALRPNSYVSMQAALRHYGMIPEHVPVVTSVTTGRPEACTNALGEFLFRHVKTDWFNGFARVEVSPGQHAFLAEPEKALLDLVHLTPRADRPECLGALRLEGLERLDPDALTRRAAGSDSPKLRRAADAILKLRRQQGARRP